MKPNFGPLSLIPAGLIWLRAALGLGVVVLCLWNDDLSRPLAALFVVLGVLTDVFDGIVARRLGVSTDELRTLDSRVDVVFFLCLLAGLLLLDASLRFELLLLLAVLGVLEVTVHAISLVRFRKQSSTHHYASKAFSILLFGLLVQLFLLPEINWYYWVVMGAGVLSFLEAGLIMLTIEKWRCDIRSYFDVLRERSVEREKGSTP